MHISNSYNENVELSFLFPSWFYFSFFSLWWSRGGLESSLNGHSSYIPSWIIAWDLSNSWLKHTELNTMPSELFCRLPRAPCFSPACLSRIAALISKLYGINTASLATTEGSLPHCDSRALTHRHGVELAVWCFVTSWRFALKTNFHITMNASFRGELSRTLKTAHSCSYLRRRSMAASGPVLKFWSSRPLWRDMSRRGQ